MTDSIDIAAWEVIPRGPHELELAPAIDRAYEAWEAADSRKNYALGELWGRLMGLVSAAQLDDDRTGYGAFLSRASRRLQLSEDDRKRVYSGDVLDPARGSDVFASILQQT